VQTLVVLGLAAMFGVGVLLPGLRKARASRGSRVRVRPEVIQCPSGDAHAQADLLKKRRQDKGLLPSALTAEVDERGRERVFLVERCGTRVTLPQVYGAFAAHQVEWNMMGKDDAWWSVLIGFQKGTAVPEASKRAFYQSGREHIEMVHRALTTSSTASAHAVYSAFEQREHGIYRPAACTMSATRPDMHLQEALLAQGVGPGATASRPFGTVLDFGCGLGRLAFGFAVQATEVLCVDQSVHHLAIAAAEWAVRRPASVEDSRVVFVPSSTDLIAAVRSKRIDFVHSVIVMQHMVPALQAVYLEQFCDVLSEGGTGWVQIPIDHRCHFFFNESCNLERSILVGGMQMHATPAAEIVALLDARGCDADVAAVGDRYIAGGPGCESGIVTFRKRRLERQPEFYVV
jgi:SAM-dependent methyltransferase